MTATDLAYTPAYELADLIATKKLSATEVVSATLERAQASQPILNAFITISADQALAAAKAADAAVMRGDKLGPLHGVPFTAKDLVNTKDVRTTFGSFVFEHNVPKTDQLCVARLKAAGAILVGKTTTPEFGHKAMTEAPLFGRTRNAWDAGRTSGGSSGGAAVATACGIAPLAISTDGGGSTRIPASCNGVVGFKKTLGLVPHDTAPDAFGNVSYLDPTTRNVRDNALMLAAMAGPHPSDPHSLYLKADGLAQAGRGEGDLKGVRIAWRAHLGNTAVDTDVLRICQDAFKVFGDLKATVSETNATFEPAEPVFQVLWASLLNARYRQYVKEFGPRMTGTLLAQMDQGVGATGEQVLAAIFARTAIYRNIQTWFETTDILVMPTMARTAVPIDHDFFGDVIINNAPAGPARRAWYPYTHPFNISGNPAITLPAGFHPDGLPVGIQLVGRHGEDAKLLRAAALFEKARPWTHKRPVLTGLDKT
jgi:aspartyl-tRNA(Asn)/glutamyl-tRNA(Gln) amidotransferase subunit A